jgi:uncharacterized protein (DUF362 family)
MLTRRQFLQALGGSALLLSLELRKGIGWQPTEPAPKSGVSLVKAQGRKIGVHTAVELLGLPEDAFAGQTVVVKPNFNSAHPFPASTHIDTLAALIELIQERGAQRVIVAERSGMGVARLVMRAKGIYELAEELGFEAIDIEDLPVEEWVHLPLEGSHWRRGVEVPKLFLEADSIVQTCCLKTHRFGGHFTMSLKNTVGMVARFSPKDGYDYMGELHGSPHQRAMIAELNTFYEPELIVLDALKAFITGGPEMGEEVSPGVILAARDRVALDAVGVAILRLHGARGMVAEGKIFEEDQIKRAVELGLGVSSPEQIELVPAEDVESRAYAREVREILAQGW